MFRVVLKSLKNDDQRIVLFDDMRSRAFAEDQRVSWRRVVGGKSWAIDRRPGLDTLDDLALFIEEYKKDLPMSQRLR